MNANEMLRVKDTVLILACCINDFCREVLSLVSNRLAKGIFDGRVIAVDKVPIYELHGKGRFADRSAADNGDFSLLGRRRHFALGATARGVKGEMKERKGKRWCLRRGQSWLERISARQKRGGRLDPRVAVDLLPD